MTLENTKILVTGANGFLGTRLVECLALAYRADVRALVRDLARSVRVCRLPVEISLGDVRDERTIRRAIDGCSIVIHCASNVDTGEPRATSTFLGTKILASAAQQQNVQRFVHISSAAVYGFPGEVEVNENHPFRPRWKNDVYGAAKIAGEDLVLSCMSQGLRAAVIQPTIIYGPYSAEWSIHPLKILRGANYVLPKVGLLSPVYVDDVVRAIILAATKSEALGQRYIISGTETLAWIQFYQAYANMGTKGRILAVGDEGYLSLVKRRADRLQGLSSLEPGDEEPAAFLPGASLWQLYKSSCRYSAEKAKHELGYRSRVKLERGMELTAEWARWVRLV
jgi:nucleoside-diphosphate-sugar epimerase